MGVADLTEIRRRLLAEERRLAEQVALLDERAREAQTPDEVAFGNADTLADEAVLVVEREKEQALRRDAEEALLAVRAALAKLDRGTYGRCEQCGRPIAPRRLQALPHARLCLDCQAKRERGR